MAHEAGHALGAVLGLCYPSNDVGAYSSVYKTISKEEWRAVFFENNVREDLNVPLRYYYSTTPSPTSNSVNLSTKMVNPVNGEPIEYRFKGQK